MTEIIDVQIIDPNQARVNVTYRGQNGDLADTVLLDATDADIKTWVTEAVRTGSIPGIGADATANFADFVVDRFGPTEQRAYALVQVRPKTPFGNELSPDLDASVRRAEERWADAEKATEVSLDEAIAIACETMTEAIEANRKQIGRNSLASADLACSQRIEKLEAAIKALKDESVRGV